MTPSSKVVGDLALALVGANADPLEFESNPTTFDIPYSVISFLNGELGDPPGGWPEPFRTKALQGRKTGPQFSDLLAEDAAALAADPRNTLNRLLFPGPGKEFASSRVLLRLVLSVLSTGEFLHGLAVGTEHEVDLEPGKRLLLGVQSSDADATGMSTVMCIVNGQLRPVQVRDTTLSGRASGAQAKVGDQATGAGRRSLVRRPI